MAYNYIPYVKSSGLIHKTYFSSHWDLIDGLPTNFVPTYHTHTKTNITDFAHTHVKANITDFAHTHTKSNITDFAHSHDERYYTEAEVNNKDYLRSNIDNRDIDTIPDDYNSKFQIKGLKSNGVIGLNGNVEGSYSGVLGVRCWSGSSGGNAHEFALTGKGNILHRHGATDTWNAWSRIAMVSDIPTTYDWAKVNNRPTTLGDYGITNAYTQYDVNTRLASKADLVGGKVPANLLPSFVDDVLEFASFDNFPYDGESGKIYIDKDTNKTYRWSGSKYAVISETLALGETPYTAYHGSKGKANALAISNINTALAGKLGTGDTATDSFKLGGLLPSKYVLKTSYDNIMNGTTQVGNTKKVDGKEVKYFTKIAFAGITPVAGVHYIVYEN